jgi:putative acetyltransferase
MPNQYESIRIEKERPDSETARALIDELESVLQPLYPSESRHGFSSEKLIKEEVAFFVLRVDGVAAGCGGVKLFGRKYGELKRIFVRPGYRGGGLSKIMMKYLEDYSSEHGCYTLKLETGIHQLEAIGLYEKLGYRRTGPFGEYKQDPLSVYFEKKLEIVP